MGYNAFTAAGEAKLFAGRCFNGDAFRINARKPGDVRAHCVAMGGYAWKLADDREIKMRDKTTACTHPIHRKNEKSIGRRAAPLRIGRGKMRANVAIGERAKDGIGERMQRNVGVRVTGESSIAWNSDSAQGDVIAWSKCVHVKAGTRAHVAE